MGYHVSTGGLRIELQNSARKALQADFLTNGARSAGR
jgi:hypothetical protein